MVEAVSLTRIVWDFLNRKKPLVGIYLILHDSVRAPD
jgi:hypothetical protein